MMVEASSDCLLHEKLPFRSMAEVRRAGKTFCDDFQHPHARTVLNSYRKFRLNCLETSLYLLKTAALPLKALVSARLKRLTSIHRKLMRRTTLPVNEMDDIIGFRVICQSLREVIDFADRVAVRLDAKSKNYLIQEHYAELGYRAIHVIVKFEQPFLDRRVTVRFEIQIRTWYQHLWACWCENQGEQAKEGFLNRLHEDGVREKVAELQECSRKVRDWEDSHPGEMQTDLPSFSGPHNVALAWFNQQRYYRFEPFRNDISAAVAYLNYLEAQRDVVPLLLIGVAGNLDLKQLLTRTHPNFLHNQPLEPRYWMPTES